MDFITRLQGYIALISNSPALTVGLHIIWWSVVVCTAIWNTMKVLDVISATMHRLKVRNNPETCHRDCIYCDFDEDEDDEDDCECEDDD